MRDLHSAPMSPSDFLIWQSGMDMLINRIVAEYTRISINLQILRATKMHVAA